MSKSQASAGPKPTESTFGASENQKDVRTSNIAAAKGFYSHISLIN